MIPVNSYGNSLRCCSGCSAHLLTQDTTSPDVYCGKCRAKQTPWDEWAAGLAKGALVYLYPYAAWNGLSHSQYLVIDRADDQLTVQVLGNPKSRMTVHISACVDRDMTPLRRRGAAY